MTEEEFDEKVKYLEWLEAEIRHVAAGGNPPWDITLEELRKERDAVAAEVFHERTTVP